MFEHYDDILDVEEACEALKIGKNRIYHLLKQGELKGYREGRHWKITQEQIKDYVMRKSRGE